MKAPRWSQCSIFSSSLYRGTKSICGHFAADNQDWIRNTFCMPQIVLKGCSSTYSGHLNLLSSHTKVTNTVWHFQLSSLLHLKWDWTEIHGYLRSLWKLKSLTTHTAFQTWELSFHVSLTMRLFLCLNRVKMQTVAGGSLSWSKGPMFPAAHSCPYIAPTVVPTEVFVQLHDEKQQGTDPAKE